MGKVSEEYRNDNSTVSEKYRNDNSTVSEAYRNNNSTVSESESALIDWFQNNKSIVSKQVEKLLNVKQARARQILKKMVQKQLIVRHGNGKNTYYVLA